MYRNAVYDSNEAKVTLFTWDDTGNRITTEHSFEPYLYVETNKKNKGPKSIYGSFLRKISFRNQRARYKFVTDFGSRKIFSNIRADQQFLIDTIGNDIEKPEAIQHPLKTYFIDIETYSPDSFPEPDTAKDIINIISLYDSSTNKFYTWGLNPYKSKQKNAVYTHCQSERELLLKFINFFSNDYPDILSGWNTEFFDIPYIVNRIGKVLGDNAQKKLSPMGTLYHRVVENDFGKKAIKWYINGISLLDYLAVYKKFSIGDRESYRLDAIGEYELGENKIDYGSSNLAALSEDNWELFTDYNIQDVNLLVNLEKKLQYLELVRMLAYAGCTNLEVALKSLSVITGAAVIKAKKQNLIIPTLTKNDDAVGYAGGHVGEPQRGFQDYVVSFDVNSLYPNIMITLNLSPETKIGTIIESDDKEVTIKTIHGKVITKPIEEFTKIINKQQIAISKAKVLFSQTKKGIIPQIVDGFYKERISLKRKMKKLQQSLQEMPKKSLEYEKIQNNINLLNIKQYTIKILINTMYGYFGNRYSPMGDVDIAKSITLTGQGVIKESNKILTKYFKQKINVDDDQIKKINPIIYNDTDSVYCSIKPLINHLNINFLNRKKRVSAEVLSLVNDMESHLNNEIQKWGSNVLNSKDCRFEFKRESICDVGLFLQKKRYILHILDDEGLPVDKFKYTGVEVVRTTVPKPVKPYIKGIVETMLTTKNRSKTNELLNEVYDKFKELPIEDISFTSGITNYEKYATKCNGFNTTKGMPNHVKAAYFYNTLIDTFNISDKYERINTGDKLKFFYVKQPNKYMIGTIGYKYYFPEKFAELFQPDLEKMFEKIIYAPIERLYDAVNWQPRKPGMMIQTDLFDLLS